MFSQILSELPFFRGKIAILMKKVAKGLNFLAAEGIIRVKRTWQI